MATTFSVTSNYAGIAAKDYIYPAVFSGETLDKGAITINQNVGFKLNVPRISDDGILADGTCDFTPTDTTTYTERVLQPVDLQVNRQYCKTDYVQMWEGQEVAGGSAFKKTPQNFLKWLIQYMGGQVGQKIETNIWQGVEASAGEFDGFITLFDADSDVIDVTTADATGGITSANVDSALQAMYEAIPQTIFNKPDLMMYVPLNVVRAWQGYLTGFGTSGLGANGYLNQGPVGEKPLNYQGIQMFYCPGLPSDRVVIAQKSNLWFGTSALSDQNEVKVIDLADIDGSQNFRLVMRFRGAVQYGFGAEVVLGDFS